MRPGLLAVALGALTFTALGCGGQGSTVQPGGSGGAGSADELRGRTFLSTAATEDGQPRQLVAGTRVSLWFTDDGRIVANTGCNTISGSVRLDGGKITVTNDLSITEMGCDPPRHAQDEWLAKLLQATPTWQLDGDQLTVSAGNTELTMIDRDVAEPPPPLEGTRWFLDTLHASGTAASVPPDANAFLVFDGGRVTGSTGCNSLEGPATVSGSTIRFGEIVLTKKACPDTLANVERAVTAVLQGEVPFKIDAGRLTLNPDAEQGLSLRGDGG
jgi:heat shock protein HslJ